MEQNLQTSEKTVQESAADCCVVCKSSDQVISFRGKLICKPCVNEAIAMK